VAVGGFAQPVQPVGVFWERQILALVSLGVPPFPASSASQQKDAAMISFTDWIVPAWVGATFTLMGGLKLHGLSRGVVGGANTPFVTRLCGT
jgi:hypothetical protein